MNAMSACRHDRVVRLEIKTVPDTPGIVNPKVCWICAECNAEFLQKIAVEYKLVHLETELLKLHRIAQIADTLYDRLAEVNTVSPRYDEEAYEVLRQYAAWKASNEQAAGMWREESI